MQRSAPKLCGIKITMGVPAQDLAKPTVHSLRTATCNCATARIGTISTVASTHTLNDNGMCTAACTTLRACSSFIVTPAALTSTGTSAKSAVVFVPLCTGVRCKHTWPSPNNPSTSGVFLRQQNVCQPCSLHPAATRNRPRPVCLLVCRRSPHLSERSLQWPSRRLRHHHHPPELREAALR